MSFSSHSIVKFGIFLARSILRTNSKPLLYCRELCLHNETEYLWSVIFQNYFKEWQRAGKSQQPRRQHLHNNFKKNFSYEGSDVLLGWLLWRELKQCWKLRACWWIFHKVYSLFLSPLAVAVEARCRLSRYRPWCEWWEYRWCTIFTFGETSVITIMIRGSFMEVIQ